MAAGSSNIRCPVCQGELAPVVLYCGRCDVRVEGTFELNEFARLATEDLHFLRIFVHCEGRIRDMESALGVSYPTIKARLAKLKEALAASAPAVTPPAVEAPQDGGIAEVLADLEAGRISFDEAMRKVKNTGEGNEG